MTNAPVWLRISSLCPLELAVNVTWYLVLSLSPPRYRSHQTFPPCPIQDLSQVSNVDEGSSPYGTEKLSSLRIMPRPRRNPFRHSPLIMSAM
ncbi:MAG: hypothetical protein ABI411_09085 [Tahibacter sp.]